MKKVAIVKAPITIRRRAKIDLLLVKRIEKMIDNPTIKK